MIKSSDVDSSKNKTIKSTTETKKNIMEQWKCIMKYLGAQKVVKY